MGGSLTTFYNDVGPILNGDPICQEECLQLA